LIKTCHVPTKKKKRRDNKISVSIIKKTRKKLKLYLCCGKSTNNKLATNIRTRRRRRSAVQFIKITLYFTVKEKLHVSSHASIVKRSA